MKTQVELFPLRKYKKRKVARPLAAGGWHHLVLKCRRPVLRLHRRAIHDLLRRAQLRFGVELRAVAVMENHIHLCVRISNRTLFAHFLRMFAGQVALRIGGGKLWTGRAWTRIVRARRDLANVVRYIEGNPVDSFDGEDFVEIRGGVLRAAHARSAGRSSETG